MICVIKTEQGEYLDKTGNKVKSIFDAKLFKNPQDTIGFVEFSTELKNKLKLND